MNEREITRCTVITYRWWRYGKNGIRPAHIPALEESADTRIAEMMMKGYTSGELCESIHIDDDDPENGVDYQGWWELKRS